MSEDYYEVEYIEDVQEQGKNKYFVLIKWKDYPSDQNTWEPWQNLSVDAAVGFMKAYIKKTTLQIKDTIGDIGNVQVKISELQAKSDIALKIKELAIDRVHKQENQKHKRKKKAAERSDSEESSIEAKAKPVVDEEDEILIKPRKRKNKRLLLSDIITESEEEIKSSTPKKPKRKSTVGTPNHQTSYPEPQPLGTPQIKDKQQKSSLNQAQIIPILGVVASPIPSLAPVASSPQSVQIVETPKVTPPSKNTTPNPKSNVRSRSSIPVAKPADLLIQSAIGPSEDSTDSYKIKKKTDKDNEYSTTSASKLISPTAGLKADERAVIGKLNYKRKVQDDNDPVTAPTVGAASKETSILAINQSNQKKDKHADGWGQLQQKISLANEEKSSKSWSLEKFEKVIPESSIKDTSNLTPAQRKSTIDITDRVSNERATSPGPRPTISSIQLALPKQSVSKPEPPKVAGPTLNMGNSPILQKTPINASQPLEKPKQVAAVPTKVPSVAFPPRGTFGTTAKPTAEVLELLDSPPNPTPPRSKAPTPLSGAPNLFTALGGLLAVPPRTGGSAGKPLLAMPRNPAVSPEVSKALNSLRTTGWLPGAPNSKSQIPGGIHNVQPGNGGMQEGLYMAQQWTGGTGFFSRHDKPPVLRVLELLPPEEVDGPEELLCRTERGVVTLGLWEGLLLCPVQTLKVLAHNSKELLGVLGALGASLGEHRLLQQDEEQDIQAEASVPVKEEAFVVEEVDTRHWTDLCVSPATAEKIVSFTDNPQIQTESVSPPPETRPVSVPLLVNVVIEQEYRRSTSVSQDPSSDSHSPEGLGSTLDKDSTEAGAAAGLLSIQLHATDPPFQPATGGNQYLLGKRNDEQEACPVVGPTQHPPNGNAASHLQDFGDPLFPPLRPN